MPTGSTLTKIGKVDFFAVLPGGLYVLLVVILIVNTNSNALNNSHALWDQMSPIVTQIHDQPITLLFMLFASYLLGSILRAMRVRWVEYMIPPFKKSFPYDIKLIAELDELNKHYEATRHNPNNTPDLTDGLPMRVFNYWKDVLCIRSPQGFDYYQTFEAKSRYFASMFVSGLIGIIGALVLFLRADSSSCIIARQLFILSGILVLAFGSQFRRVRFQEAKALLFLYVSHLQQASKKE